MGMLLLDNVEDIKKRISVWIKNKIEEIGI